MRKFILMAMVLAGCTGSGDVTITTWGEELIEQGIPATKFADGSQVTYTKFLVVLSNVTLATKTGTEGPKQPLPVVVDLVKPGTKTVVKMEKTPAVKWDAVSYEIVPLTALTLPVGEVIQTDFDAMRNLGSSVFVEGRLTRNGVTKTFSWHFDLATRYSNCVSPDLGEGVTVPAGASETVELTIHGDHLWYDELQAAEADMRGEAVFNADTNADGVITQAELSAVQLTTLPLGQYETAGASSVKTLNDFVRSLVRTLGHFRGEGECSVSAK